MKTSALIALMTAAGTAQAQLYITELMYSGGGDEFVEFTNTGSTAIDVTGWTYATASAGSYDMSALGIIGAGESVIITQSDAQSFRDNWGLASGVNILGGLVNTLARNDTISIYDASNSLIDQLAYGDSDFEGSVRPREYSANVLPGSLGLNDPYSLVLSAGGDLFGSWLSGEFDRGNPGSYPVPAPSALLVLGAGTVVARRRRRTR